MTVSGSHVACCTIFVLRYLDDEEYAAGAAATFPSRGRVEFAEREYTFADVFAGQGGGADEQAAIFNAVARPLVDAALDGINAAVVAYGASGSGKSYTMLGGGADVICGAERGILPRALDDLFARITQRNAAAAAEAAAGAATGGVDFDACLPDVYSVSVKVVEVHGERVTDLLRAPTARGRRPEVQLVDLALEDGRSPAKNAGAAAGVAAAGFTARRSSAEHLIATKALRCTATAWVLTVAESFAKF